MHQTASVPAQTTNETNEIASLGNAYTIWVDSVQEINTTDSAISAGTLALSGAQPKFSEVKAGNLVDDSRLQYIYDAWHRLVKVRSDRDTDVVIQQAEFDGQGRRIRKVVTQSGDLDGTLVYSYDGSGIVEIRNGSGDVVNQVYRGAEYIDEIVGMRLEEGYAVILQDANFNVVGAVDMAGQVLERVFYEPYGLPVFEGETRFGDYDGNHSVDSTDDADLGSGQTCWGAAPTGACRVFDFNFDLTLDSSDETVMTALTSLSSTEHRLYGRTTSPLGLRFLHQGLEHDPEISSYQNRARQYLPVEERFAQRDPLGYADNSNLYGYELQNTLSNSDPSGLICGLLTPAVCGTWPPTLGGYPPALPPSKTNCDTYPPGLCYDAVNARCMCRCMGDDTWSRLVRGCLACCYCNRWASLKNCHKICYKYGNQHASRPWAKLVTCAARCAGGQEGNPICRTISKCPGNTILCDCGLGSGGQCMTLPSCKQFCKNTAGCNWPTEW